MTLISSSENVTAMRNAIITPYLQILKNFQTKLRQTAHFSSIDEKKLNEILFAEKNSVVAHLREIVILFERITNPQHNDISMIQHIPFFICQSPLIYAKM